MYMPLVPALPLPYLLAKLHPCFNPALLLLLTPALGRWTWLEEGKPHNSGCLVFFSIPPLTLGGLWCCPETLPRVLQFGLSPTLLGGCFLLFFSLQTSRPPPPSSLLAFDYAHYFIEKRKQSRGKNTKIKITHPAQIPSRVSTYFLHPCSLPFLFLRMSSEDFFPRPALYWAPTPYPSYLLSIQGHWSAGTASTVPGTHFTLRDPWKCLIPSKVKRQISQRKGFNT